jgi:hypothetical protein
MWLWSSPLAAQDWLALLFFTYILWGVFMSFNAVFMLLQEQPVLAWECALGMYVLSSSYIVSRMAGDQPMELALPTAFMVIMYLMARLNPSLATFAFTLAIILGYVLIVEGLYVTVRAVMMDAKRASTLLTVIMIMLTFGWVLGAQHADVNGAGQVHQLHLLLLLPAPCRGHHR